MKVFSTSESIQNQIKAYKLSGKSIGFVPTMGALHKGHISLLEEAKSKCDITVVSIFVNPTQFNNPSDLENYPRTFEEDKKILEAYSCDVLFSPTIDEIYPDDYQEIFLDIGMLDKVMEGKERPGHFNGVINVVSKLFSIVTPDKAFFGLKDFQQVAVIKFMTDSLRFPIEIIAVPTMREESGLAMSSRNKRLNAAQQSEAVHIFDTLKYLKNLVKSTTPEIAMEKAITFFENSRLELEYIEIVNPLSLVKLSDEWCSGATACIVAHLDNVRLIDNLQLVD